ncbi:MAG TPA: TonB-dependent receptor [Candidatus Angelobacter sp.]|nr:TonB-dependent receptor [Candidatus Angelobacter sp.]
MKRLHQFCTIAFLFCCLPLTLANAQSAASAQISGTVVDPQGAVVPGAKVTATNQATGVQRSVNTTSTGNYVIPNLQPGKYDVGVSAKGFAPGTTKDVVLNLGDQRDLGFKLGLAGSTESVEVTTTAPLIETTKTDVSSSVTSLDMERLPTIAGAGGVVNDYAQLALTAPGVKADTSGLTTDLIAPGSINNRGNLYNVDGANITDQLVSGRDSTGASVDEVQEFQVITNNYNAEYGQATGLVMNVVTKSGSNSVHGEGHMYFRGRNLAASDPFYNLGILGDSRCPSATTIDGCPRAPFHRKEGGFTVGGPFIKNKLFWFTSFENSRQGVPLTLTPFGNSVTVQSPNNNLLYAGKVDYKITENELLTMRYAVDRFRSANVIVQTGLNVTPDDLTSSTINNASFNVGLVSTLRPTLINEARFVFYRFVSTTSDNSTVPGIIHPDGTQTGANFCCPQGGLQKRYQYIDNMTWSHGTHTTKFGFNISYYPWNSLFPQFHFGQYVANAADNAATSFTIAFGPGEVTSKDNIYGFYAQDTWKLTRKLTMNAGLRWDYEAGAFKGGKIPGPNGTCLMGNGLISACSSDKNNFQPRLGFTYAPWDKTLFHVGFAETTMLAFNNVVLDSLNFDGTTLFTVTIDGTTPAGAAVLAAFPNTPSPALLAPFAPSTNPANFGRIRPIAANLRNPEMRMVNFGIEQQFTPTLKGEIQYIGQFGFGLFGERDTNAPPLTADPAHPGFFFYGPRPNPRFGAIRTNENSRTSHYNGLLVSTNKTFGHHISFNASYTWSHATASSEDFFGISEPGDFRTISAEMGPAYNDVRHAANMGVVLDSGKLTTNRFMGWVANNLGLSWVGQIQSGRPYPLSTGDTAFANGSRFFGAGSETQQRPNVLPDGTISVAGIGSAGGVIGNFGPNAPAACIAAGNPAAICNTIQNTFLAPAGASPFGPEDFLTGEVVDFKLANGNLERNAARGSAFAKFDASVHKQFTVHENVKVEFRFDAFNVFNHSNWTSFNSNDVLTALGLSFDPNCTNCQRLNGTFAGNAGQTLHISDLRQGKISSDFTNPVFGGLGDPAAMDAPRRLQLSFHVRF